jgi:hypothetical protein
VGTSADEKLMKNIQQVALVHLSGVFRRVLVIAATFATTVYGNAAVGALPTPTVVYDTLQAVDYGGQGFLQSIELGQEVALAGEARQVVSFTAFLGDNDTTQFRLKFYLLDGPSGAPNTVLWQSSLQTYPWIAPYFNRKHITIPVPGIVVPDRFAWMIEDPVPGDGNSVLMCATSASFVGTPGPAWQRFYPGGDMRRDQYQFLFGAKIVAIPEPASGGIAMVAAGWSIIHFRRRGGVPHRRL